MRAIPYALSVLDTGSYVGMTHTWVLDAGTCLRVNGRKNKDAARLRRMLCPWQKAVVMLEAGEIAKEDYDKWRCHYPEYDEAQKIAGAISQELSDRLLKDLNSDGDKER